VIKAWGNGIDAALVKWVAFRQTFQRQPKTKNGPVVLDGRYGVLRTSWFEPAVWAHHRANPKPIESN
jgi:hypothetical protein